MSYSDVNLSISPDPDDNHITPAVEPDRYADRMAEWMEHCQPVTAEQVWFVEQIVVESVRLDRLRKRERQLIGYLARRTSLCWDDDRRLEAEILAATIGKKPALVAARLQQTRHGCELLLDRWHALGRLFEANGEWTEAQKALAFDLLGSVPDLRLGEPWEWAGHDSPRALVECEVERLERLKTGSLDQLDAFERASAEQGLGIELARPLGQLNREEAASVRRFQWA